MVEGIKISKKAGYLAILIMGIVSMLRDIVHESGRGIAPDHLKHLGASAFSVSALSGVGDFIGMS